MVRRTVRWVPSGQETSGSNSTFFEYSGSRLTAQSTGSATSLPAERTPVFKYLYDNGNLDCIVDATYAGSCGSAGATNLVKDYDYDYLDRLKTFSGYDTASNVKTDEASYVYDALDRVWEQTEKHRATPSHPPSRTPTTSTATASRCRTRRSAPPRRRTTSTPTTCTARSACC